MRVNGAALKVIRERSGLTRTALAEMAGIKQSHVSNIEAGRRNASPDVMLALASALKVDLAAIISDPQSMADR